MKRILILILVLVLAGCKIQQNKIETHSHNDSIDTKSELKIDSIYIDRWHTLIEKGDTVHLTDSIVIYKYKLIDKKDTVMCFKTDTLTQKEVITETVVKYKNGWRGWVAFGVLLLGIVVYVIIKLKH